MLIEESVVQRMSVIIKEFNVHVENLFFRTIIDAPNGLPYDKQTPDIQKDLHNHISAELFTCGKGEVIIKTQGKTIILKAGDTAIIPPGVFHRAELLSENSQVYTVSFICFENKNKNRTDLYKSFLIFFEKKEIKIYKNKFEIFEKVRQILEESKKSDNFLPAFYMLELILNLLSKEHNVILKEQLEDTGKVDLKRIMQLEELVELNYMKNWTLDDYAENLFVSKRTLDRISKKRFNASLHQTITQKRIKMSEILLLTTDMTIEMISSKVGFSSVSGFYKEFGKIYGVSPAKYRKNNSN